jgi:hypothetical protein
MRTTHQHRFASAAALAALAALAAAAPTPATITVQWSNVTRALTTSVGFQTVVNAVTTRESPFHDAVYERIAALASPWQRYVPWLLFPRLGVAELEPPSTGALCGFVASGGAAGRWSTTLDCGAHGAGVIDGVVFADYGLSVGFCNALVASPACHKDVAAVVAAACVGKASCTLLSSDATFGAAPCDGARLAVEVTCSNKAVTTFTYWVSSGRTRCAGPGAWPARAHAHPHPNRHRTTLCRTLRSWTRACSTSSPRQMRPIARAFRT